MGAEEVGVGYLKRDRHAHRQTNEFVCPHGRTPPGGTLVCLKDAGLCFSQDYLTRMFVSLRQVVEGQRPDGRTGGARQHPDAQRIDITRPRQGGAQLKIPVVRRRLVDRPAGLVSGLYVLDIYDGAHRHGRGRSVLFYVGITCNRSPGG